MCRRQQRSRAVWRTRLIPIRCSCRSRMTTIKEKSCILSLAPRGPQLALQPPHTMTGLSEIRSFCWTLNRRHSQYRATPSAGMCTHRSREDRQSSCSSGTCHSHTAPTNAAHSIHNTNVSHVGSHIGLKRKISASAQTAAAIAHMSSERSKTDLIVAFGFSFSRNRLIARRILADGRAHTTASAGTC